MGSKRSVEVLEILLVLLLVLIVCLASVSLTSDASQKGQGIYLGSCLSFDDGYEFCNHMWVNNISYVTVYKDGVQVDLVVVLVFNTAESNGYSITPAGLYVYVEPTP